MTRDTIFDFLAARAKLPGSLGRLEELTAQLCAVQQALAPRTTPGGSSSSLPMMGLSWGE
jgi:hypothetical protein